MSKIDLTKIEGYDTMTAEEKLKALEDFEIPDAQEPDYTGWVKKDVLDKATKDAAEWKKKYNDTLTDAQKKGVIDSEKQAQMEKELAELKRDKAVSQNIAKLLALGYEEDLATETAEAMADNDMAKVFENQKKFKESLEKKIKAEALKNMDRPDGTGNTDARRFVTVATTHTAREASSATTPRARSAGSWKSAWRTSPACNRPRNSLTSFTNAVICAISSSVHSRMFHSNPEQPSSDIAAR